MRKLLIILFTLIEASGFAQVKLNKEQQQVQKVVIDMFQTLSDRDFNKLKANCEPDLMVLENGIIWNLDSLYEKINQNKLIPDFTRLNTFDFIDTHVSNTIAWTSYTNQAEVTKNGQHGFVKWMETAILAKDDKVWKIKVLHSTVLKRWQ